MIKKGVDCEEGKSPEVQIIDNLLCQIFRDRLESQLDDCGDPVRLSREEREALTYMKKYARTQTLRLANLQRRFKL